MSSSNNTSSQDYRIPKTIMHLCDKFEPISITTKAADGSDVPYQATNIIAEYVYMPSAQYKWEIQLPKTSTKEDESGKENQLEGCLLVQFKGGLDVKGSSNQRGIGNFYVSIFEKVQHHNLPGPDKKLPKVVAVYNNAFSLAASQIFFDDQWCMVQPLRADFEAKSKQLTWAMEVSNKGKQVDKVWEYAQEMKKKALEAADAYNQSQNSQVKALPLSDSSIEEEKEEDDEVIEALLAKKKKNKKTVDDDNESEIVGSKRGLEVEGNELDTPKGKKKLKM